MNVPVLTDVIYASGSMVQAPRKEATLAGPDQAAKSLYAQALRMIRDHVPADEVAKATGLPVEAVRVYQRDQLLPFDAWWCGLDKGRQDVLLNNRWLMAEESFKAGVMLQLEHASAPEYQPPASTAHPQDEDCEITIEELDVSGSVRNNNDAAAIITIVGDLPSGHCFNNPWEASGFR